MLGRWIIEHSLKANNQIIMATHSADFLDSFSKHKEVNILRIQRNGDNTCLTQLKPSTISQFAEDPIISNLPMLESVFYHGIILCEGDRDRIIYRAVHRKKVSQNEDILFINTNGKQGTKKVIPFLTETNLRFKVSIDFDLLLDKPLFSTIIKSITNDVLVQKSTIELRSSLEQQFFKDSENAIVSKITNQVSKYLREVEKMEDKSHRQFKDTITRILNLSKRDRIKQYGLMAFSPTHRSKVRNLLNDCKSLGLYIVPNGEIESFIPLDIKKEDWLISALERISEDNIPPKFITFLKEVDKSVRR